MVYVLNTDGSPLMPCSAAIARLLLKEGYARVKCRTPFTLKLLRVPETTYTQSLAHGVDTGSDKIGSTVVTQQGDVVYASEVTIRNDINKKMTGRKSCRRNRRSRKTRYRAARFAYRGNSIKSDRFSPTMTSKINAHLKEVSYVASILPITTLILETGNFDPHALKNPDVLKDSSLYQKGVNYGFANTKAYVLCRDGYVCQHCKGKSKDTRLHVHHLVYRSNGGSDDEANLLALCETCHRGVHDNSIVLKKIGKRKGQLNHATQMNSIRVQCLRALPHAQETFGFITKEHRQLLGLEKSHINDAAVIASQGHLINFNGAKLIEKKCVSDGDYQQMKGVRGQQRIPTGKIKGFRKFDKVRYQGVDCFIKGRMSTGYAILMDINGEKLTFNNIPKLNGMKRLSARTSWIMSQKTTANICS